MPESGIRELPLRFRGETAVVTGAASGIGRACVDLLSAGGLRVVSIDRDEVVRDLAHQWREHGRDVTGCVADVVDESAVSEALNEANAEGLAYAVNCAGIHGQVSFDQITLDEWRRVLDVNLLGAFAASRAAVGWMRRTGFGSIVNVTSTEARHVVALVNPEAVPHYAASKAALEMLTRSMAHSLAGDDIRVNAVAPGFTATPMTAGNHGAHALVPEAQARQLIKRLAEPTEIASAVAFLLSDNASYITASTLAVDGGFMSA